MDDQDYLSSPRLDQDSDHDHAVEKDIRRAMILPEHSARSKTTDDMNSDDKLTPLVANRKLYRAHRQMRLAVLEASKRFEEEQLRRTKAELQEAQQPSDQQPSDSRHFGAGLVMKRGKKKEVSSDAIRSLMSERMSTQKTLVDIAARKGGRGRRARKKTVSDMSGMLLSIPPSELSQSNLNEPPPTKEETPEDIIDESNLDLHDITEPEPTVLGVFRKSTDPFEHMNKQMASVLGKTFPDSNVNQKVLPTRKSSVGSADSAKSSSSIKLSVSDGELKSMQPQPFTP